MTSSKKPKSAAQRLRERLADRDHMVVAPGVHDGLSARVALSLGFDTLYMTGAGTSMSRLGWADLGLASLNDMAEQGDMLASLDPSVPVIADADTGYGGPIMVARTVSKYVRAGIAGMHLEDQVQEKRCGHLQGKQTVCRNVYASRLRAAVAAREDLGADIVLIARTDSRQSLGFQEAYERLKEAVEIGVDAVFPEGLTSKDEAREMCRLMGDTPVLLNMVSSGVTPEITVEEAKAMGFRIMIFPAISYEASMLGVKNALQKLQQSGRQPLVTSGVKEAFSICGLDKCIEIDQRAGGKAYVDI